MLLIGLYYIIIGWHVNWIEMVELCFGCKMNCDENLIVIENVMWWVVNWVNVMRCVVRCVLNCDEKCEVLWLRMGKDDSWECKMCDRESWTGRIATRMCEMARLSRVDSLVGGHLIVKWYEKWNEKKHEEMWGQVRLSHPFPICWELIWIECDWNWIVLIDWLCW